VACASPGGFILRVEFLNLRAVVKTIFLLGHFVEDRPRRFIAVTKAALIVGVENGWANL
jgi:hypothetical protein